MSIPLKQSTAGQVIVIPRQLDSTDFNTEETGLTIANTDIKLWKAAATTLANKNSGGATHIANGVYHLTLDATDTNTLGPLIVMVHVSGAMSVERVCTVYPANVYDSLFAGTDLLQVDVDQIDGSATAATSQSVLLLNAIINATVAASPSPTTTTFACNLTGSSYPDSCFRSASVVFNTGSNAGGVSRGVISSFTSSSGLIVLNTALPFTPSAGQTFQIVGVAV